MMAILLEVSNLVFALFGFPEFAWKSQIDLARVSPFRDGLLVTGMLETTLVPTVIHLTLGHQSYHGSLVTLSTEDKRVNPREHADFC